MLYGENMTQYRQLMRGLNTGRLHSVATSYLRFQRSLALYPYSLRIVYEPLYGSPKADTRLLVIIFALGTLKILQTERFCPPNSQNLNLLKDCCILANRKEDFDEYQFFRSK